MIDRKAVTITWNLRGNGQYTHQMEPSTKGKIPEVPSTTTLAYQVQVVQWQAQI